MLNIESVQQTLNLTLDSEYIHVFVPVEALTWIRSFAIVLLIVAYAMRHVEVKKPAARAPPQPITPLIVTPELLENLRSLLTQTTVSEEANTQTLLLAEGEQSTNTSQETSVEGDDEQAANNGGRVRAYLVLHPGAKVREVAEALAISVSTANKWMSRVKS